MAAALLLQLAAMLALAALSAFFAAAETALTAASRAEMERLAGIGNARARIVNGLRADKEKLIGALLLGGTLANVLVAALATVLLIRPLGAGAVPVAALLVSAGLLIFAAVLPRTYAIHNADSVALWAAPAVRSAVAVLAPVMRALSGFAAALLRLSRANRRDVTVTDYVDELRGAIERHRGPEREVPHERAMLRSILDLGDVTVAEIMTHRRQVESLDIDRPRAQLVDVVLSSPYTRLPLWQGDPDNIIGVLHAKDVLRAIRRVHGNAERVDLLRVAAKPWFIPDTTTLLDQLQAFRARREHFALVVDEYGGLQGVVTLEDVLEEIVGDISDEHDVPVAGVRPQANGTLIVDGRVTLRDLNRQFEWHLPDHHASTLAGLVLYEAQRLPDVGQVFTFYGFRFEILRRQRNQVTSLRVTPPDAARPAGRGVDIGAPRP